MTIKYLNIARHAPNRTPDTSSLEICNTARRAKGIEARGLRVVGVLEHNTVITFDYESLLLLRDWTIEQLKSTPPNLFTKKVQS